MLTPPFTSLEQFGSQFSERGFAVLSPDHFAKQTNLSLENLNTLKAFWDHLPRDPYLKDGGRYRYRRHASYIVRGANLELAPHRAHWQSLDYNALHGGIERWFEPLQPELSKNQHWQQLISEAEGSIGLRFTLQDSWSALLLNDAKMIHETTPIQPIASPGYRDTLVITFRRNSFQEPPLHHDQ